MTTLKENLPRDTEELLTLKTSWMMDVEKNKVILTESYSYPRACLTRDNNFHPSPKVLYQCTFVVMPSLLRTLQPIDACWLQVITCYPCTGPIKRTNPLFSAANRAARRKERAKLASIHNGTFLEDVATAEVNNAVHSQNWGNSGVPLEPFNLKHERETGYFDDDGNYIAYCDAEPDDAWLESLPRGASFSSLALPHQIFVDFSHVTGTLHISESSAMLGT